MTVAKEPFTGESSKQAVKPLRREGRSIPAALYARVQFCLRKSHAGPRVQQAPGLPCALIFGRANEDANLGRITPRESEVIFGRHHPRRRVIQYSRDSSDRIEKPRR